MSFKRFNFINISALEENRSKCIKKLQETIAELLSTEETYIENMGIVVNGYLREYRDANSTIPVPEDLRDMKGLIVFANIEEIYNWHKDFLYKALKQNSHSPDQIAKIFISSSCQFHMYAKYANNKDLSDLIVNDNRNYFCEVQQKLGHKLAIADFLINPVQRLGRYQLFLERIVSALRKLGCDAQNVENALAMVKTIVRGIERFTSLKGIRNYTGDITDLGTLIHHGQLTCKYNGKKRRHSAFLFKKMLVFTDSTKARNKYSSPTYNFRFEMPMNQIQLKELPNKRFMLKHCCPNTEDLVLVCHGETDVLHQEWLQNIKDQLQLQEDLVMDLVNPCSNDNEILM